jgi:hypoxanthine phosphoribosyltransferase
MKSYDYENRQGLEEIGWERFYQLTSQVVESLADARVEAVVGIARAGLIPAATVACALRLMLYPVGVSRRINDKVVYKQPLWIADVISEVKGKIVAVVDEISDTGETLALVANRVRERGANQVITASLVSHSWADPQPDVVGLVTDALVIFPWDRQVYQEGKWQSHPEYDEAVKKLR